MAYFFFNKKYNVSYFAQPGRLFRVYGHVELMLVNNFFKLLLWLNMWPEKRKLSSLTFSYFFKVPALVKSVHRQMKEKSIKTRQGCFALLTELVQVYPGALTHHIPALIPGIQFSLGWVYLKEYSLKIDKGSPSIFCNLGITRMFVVILILVGKIDYLLM